MLAEQAPTPSWNPPLDHPVETKEILFFRYHAYRQRQVSQLLHVMPREGVRDLYGKARDWAKSQGVHDSRDPMTALLRYCETILPLPPFEVWLADREANPLGHLEDVSNNGAIGGETRPGRLETRTFEARGSTWMASLHVFRRDGAWRGFVQFSEVRIDEGPRYHTANIFNEDSPSEIRRRFLDFGEPSLTAFLTSVLP